MTGTKRDVKIKKGTDLNSSSKNGFFMIKPANEWIDEAKKRPIPKMLFDEFWYENELCILFADTNLGKSILAVQIADSISYGKAISGFKLEAEEQDVLYFDFELSDKQFENRYSNNFTDHYLFSDNLKRVEMNPETELPVNTDFEEYLFQSLEMAISKNQCKVLIIDNITYLRNETEKAKDALPLVKGLQALKKKYSLSILALAHTPKRDLSKQITRNDLSGSKMLMNFIDSSFAIGESHNDKNIRYIKQIKVRHSEVKYDSENVCVCQIIKSNNFLQFEFLNFDSERTHLRTISKTERDDIIEQAKQLSEQGKSQREIAKELGIGASTVNKYLKLSRSQCSQ